MAVVEEDIHDPVPEKLRLLKSPVKGDESNNIDAAVGHLGYRSDPDDEPILMRNSDSTNLEVFYDLFLAVCCLGLGLLWITWFLTGMYDVRFVTDCIFERAARAVHLGVLVGFTVTSPNFDPNDQQPVVFRTFSLILMVSRLCLAVEYASIILHVRQYKRSILPLAAMVGLNFAAAMVYLGITFRFTGGSSRVFYTWYALGAAEVLLNLGLSIRFKVLSFQSTHLIRRASLLTLIIFGEGVAVACGAITKIVSVGHDEWTGGTIGVVAANVAAVYIVFMVYFDWMRHLHLPVWRQLAWTILHFPLHLTMTLFMEGAAQLIIFYKGAENSALVANKFMSVLTEIESLDQVHDVLYNFTMEMVERYEPKYTFQYTDIENALNGIAEIDWSSAEEELGPDPTEDEAWQHVAFQQFFFHAVNILLTLDNVVYNAYGVDFVAAQAEEAALPTDPTEQDNQNFLVGVSERNFVRFRTLFQYTFVSAGSFLGLANLLYCISRIEKWNRWAIIRTSINFLIALGIALVTLVSQNFTHLENYRSTPYILPTLLFAYLIVITMNHLRGLQPIFGFPQFSFLAKKKSHDTEYVQQQTELMTTKYDPGEQNDPAAAAYQYPSQQYAPSTDSAPGRTPAGQQQGPQGQFYEYSGEVGYRPV
ncbi:hypothetical protein SODALDRAFT_330418 [Sodiomyces alkalinus F11]|uniref:Uncharacterized protein n=1 Tax=Sodiomyces alkalinus (strain CBS 110278 / VKM F-3762 / F11) TaxID=1314773 RepID=A0A3N2Q1U1_SODAK|nr:hypothetical protein SODALDRAFT_330418 [Sodiomyces alkalinus F11]ROT40676.1 hypothetical protein SODALDRAFT_330418 [Sodiomyces alkalinus F11]